MCRLSLQSWCVVGVVWLLTHTGCRTRLAPGNGNSSGPASTPVETELDTKFITSTTLMSRIHGLAPWPDTSSTHENFTQEEWQQYIRVALLVQQLEPEVVAKALADYIVHYETSFDPAVNCIDEWSKLTILLRVAFVVPEEEIPPTGRIGSDAPMSWGGVAVHDYEIRPNSYGFPVRWTEFGPTLTAQRVGYNGGRYEAETEYRQFIRKFKFREHLDALIGGGHGGPGPLPPQRTNARSQRPKLPPPPATTGK